MAEHKPEHEASEPIRIARNGTRLTVRSDFLGTLLGLVAVGWNGLKEVIPRQTEGSLESQLKKQSEFIDAAKLEAAAKVVENKYEVEKQDAIRATLADHEARIKALERGKSL